MQCPRCSYMLSESDALLCRVGETHYCPQCWSKIPDSAEPVAHPDGGTHDATADVSSNRTGKGAISADKSKQKHPLDGN